MEDILGKLRTIWRGTIESGGGHCPVCDRWGRVYSRPINRTMAKSLVWLAHAKPDAQGWVDVPSTAPRWVVQSNQLPTLRWWGFIERKANDSNSKTKHLGLWRMTPAGVDFVRHGARAPKSVFTYNGAVQGYSTETVVLRDCFLDNFDYNGTMSAYIPVNLRTQR